MPSIGVSVKWGKEKYELTANTDESPLVFKSQLFALTSVQPDRQKILCKGKTIGDDSWTGIDVRDGAQMMMMGSADSVPTAPTSKPQFLEDMTAAQAAAAMHEPAGMKNLGNTCYMNATLQILKTVPELVDALQHFKGDVSAVSDSTPTAGLTAITAAVRDLYALMNRTTNRQSTDVIPLVMMQVLHMVLPRFSDKDDHGHFMQQDANEFLTELLRVFQQKLTVRESNGAVAAAAPDRNASVIDRYLGGTFQVTLKNLESADEPIEMKTEKFVQLSCFLSQEVKYLQLGVKSKLVEEITKNSTILARDAKYQRTAEIARLPAYLCIQMVRFFYKERDKVNAKILKDVKFPLIYDAYELCTPELRKKLDPMRMLMKDDDDRRLERLKAQKAGDLEANIVMTKQEYPFSFEDDIGSNNSGFYELQAVLTHKGRSSNSGHYVGWIRLSGDRWCMCDDDQVRMIGSDDVLKLSGGGDWHCAYVLLYGPKKLVTETPSTTQAAVANAVVDATKHN